MVLDAKSGHVLAASSAPVPLPGATTHAPQVPDEVRADFNDEHGYGVVAGPGIDESRADECDELRWDAHCARWRLQYEPPRETPESLADRATYSGGDPRLAPPSTDNRALGRNYGLGSTFKVVVAAAYLRLPGTTIDDPVPAPLSYDSGPRTLFNHNDSYCRGTAADGTIALSQALAVSCNTAFLELADDLGWDAIRDTAADFGFVVGPVGGERGTAWLAETATGIDSRVPREADRAQQANNVLGGGAVEGTPLHMAAVMGALANGGELVQPTLVSALTPPFGGPRREVEPQRRRVLTTDQANDLWGGLAGTARPGGTAADLAHWADRNPRVKTGTHDLYGGDPPPAGSSPPRSPGWSGRSTPRPGRWRSRSRWRPGTSARARPARGGWPTRWWPR
ncbi:penicillin-binding transpeptidase domain-containing protein [Actinokineospora soli]|uniref:Penicillin-binding transpeptidase domain-containing protein n=1 Tax=Actinokineospora soli TaxID=1048753 RepID=A0ABW2TTE9_9PSEU